MRLMRHTFEKDLRRLWPAALATCVMLATLSSADRWRADWVPSPLEAWMNPLLTMAWACLVALAVLEEPLVGDRHFWVTRPHRWPSLLAAKLLFVLLAIHLPSFLADLFVLAARGFSPADSLGGLLWKQVLFLGAVTLPAIALASLVRNFTHFVILAFIVTAGILMLNGGFQNYPEFTRQQSEVRHALLRIVLAAASLAVIWTQYARRRVVPARMMAIAAALAAASLSAWLPAAAEYALPGGGSHEPPRIQLGNAPLNDDLARRFRMSAMPSVFVPIAIAPGAGADRFHIPFVNLEIVAPGGARLRSVPPFSNRAFEKIDLSAYPMFASEDLGWLVLRFSGPAWERVKNATVRLRGTAAVEFYRSGPTTVMPTDGTAGVPDLGRCTAGLLDDRFSEEMLKVLCESPRSLPVAFIVLRHAASGRQWREGLNSSITYAPGPHETWLSPLNRSQSFFRLTNEVPSATGSQWLVPKTYLSSSRLEITPRVATGRARASFDFSGVKLASWQAPR